MVNKKSLNYPNSKKIEKFDPSKEFFVIDTFNINSVRTRLYGYAFTKENARIIQNHTYNDNMNLDISGSFVLVKTSKDTITISQDFNGSFGLYLYKDKEYCNKP